MGFHRKISSLAAPRVRAGTIQDYNKAFFSGEPIPDLWLSALSSSGVAVTPDLARTLSAMYCGVSTIAYDLSTLPAETWKYRSDGGKDRIRGTAQEWAKGGIGDLAYMLQWAPNDYQTATEFFAGQVAQFLMRGKAYAEIVDGPKGFLSQLLPRHPDRVFPERLPSGAIRYKLIEANGQPRYVSQQEMHVVRDISTDPLSSPSMVSYAASGLSISLAAESAAGKFFKTGMTAAMLATYQGEKEDDDEKDLHASISRFAAGVDNSFGLMLVPDDIKISNLAVEPDKAQMMLAREWTVYEVARWLRISPRKLMVRTAGAGGYASAYQDAIDHVVGCIRPLAHTFEQAIQRDLILAKDTYFVKFQLRELLRGDPAQMAEFIEKTIASRAMTPSEVRMLFLDLNPDEHLDKLSESDNQPGKTGTKPARPAKETAPPSARLLLRGVLAVHDDALRCVRRERAAVTKLGVKHASDVDGWKKGLRDFYADHAAFVAQTMRISMDIARGYAGQHGTAFEVKSLAMIDGDAGQAWEAHEACELAELSLMDTAVAA
jgi:HK97 family phage portal protein